MNVVVDETQAMRELILKCQTRLDVLRGCDDRDKELLVVVGLPRTDWEKNK